MDSGLKKSLSGIPLLTLRAGPRDGEDWKNRCKQELQSLIKYLKSNKEQDKDWFTIKCNPAGTTWEGKCWTFHEKLKYEFDFCFDIPVGYPATAPEIRVPALDGKTAKMYHGGKICLTIHFKPLWGKNTPRFGIAHAMALGLGPWLAAEIPDLVARGVIKHDEDSKTIVV